MTFDDILDQVIALLKRQGRVSYGAMKRRFDLDDAYLEDLKGEILFAYPVVDEDGRGLVWTGETASAQAVISPPAQTTQQPAAQEHPAPQDAPLLTTPPIPEAARRQLTVMFCDVVDSTKLSGQLDPEEYRDVLRAYQAACVEAIQRFDGYIAQHLGDGLLVYFGFPTAPEDDAQRAILAGLGMLDALHTLNTRLEHEHGIRLSIRVGLHTGLTVIGDIGAGQKHELLAFGEAPNIAARIQSLAAPDTVAISPDTYRVLEDLHWTDPSTLELFDLLMDQIPTVSLCALLTCRPTFQPPWSSRSYLTQVTLSRLSQPQVGRMAEHVAGGKRLPAEVLRQVVAKTDGVPLFVEEMTKAVLESGILQDVNGQYEMTGSVSALAIPTTLHDSLMARLDRLVTAKAVAQYAAVLGRHFSYAVLHAVSQLDEPTLQRELGRLVDAELLYQRGLPPQATYLFKHALIRDIAYESLLRSTRQGDHQRVAHILEEHFPAPVYTWFTEGFETPDVQEAKALLDELS